MADKAEAPKLISELSEACVRYVQQALGLELDGTQETLPILDHYLRECTDGDEIQPEMLGLIVPAAGAYFGEVVRKDASPCSWHCPDEDFEEFRLEFSRYYLCFNPMGAALECLQNDKAPGWNAHIQVMPEDESLLAELLDRTHVAEDDYFRLAVRYETLQQVDYFLAAKARARGKPTPLFTREVYEAVSANQLPNKQA